MSNSRTVPTTASPDVSTFKILSEGAALSYAYQVMSVSISSEINRIPKASFILLDGEAAAETFRISDGDELIPGKKIEIKAGYRGKEDTVFSGIVVKHGIRIKRGSSYLVIECRGKAIDMSLEKKRKYFEEMSDSEVIGELLQPYGLDKEIESTTQKHESLVQLECTDWDFLLQRAHEAGKMVWMEEDKIIVKKPALTEEVNLSLLYGATILELDAEIDARTQPEALKAFSWDYSKQELTEAEAAEPSLSLNGDLPASDLARAGVTRAYSQTIAEPVLKEIAEAELLKARLSKIRGRVRCQGNTEVKPGRVINLDGIGSRFKGKAFISGYRHQLAGGNWETDIQFGYPEDLRSQSLSSGLAFSGLYIGVVITIEEDPKGEHRVKVRLPVIGSGQEGVWARVAAPDAGENRGMFFRPQPEDEVVVGFLQNDPNHPVVLGMCNSSAKPAPIEPKDTNYEKGYVSAEKIRFWIDDEKKSLTFETPGGNSLVFSDDEKGIFMEDQHGNKFSMTEDGIAFESPKDIKIKATKNIELEGLKVDAKATSGFKADGGGGCELSAGNGVTAVKGGTVMLN